MSKRRVEFLEPVRLGRNQHEQGDICSFPTAEADQYIAFGWCKCCETDETGERKPGAQALHVHDSEQESSRTSE